MGHSDVSLNENGKIQAALCGKYISKAYPKISAFYSSTLLRARETAEIIEKELNLEGNIIYSPLITERSFGSLEGLSYAEVRNHLKNKNGKWDITVKPPNGESALEFYTRVSKGIDSILNDNEWDKNDLVLVLTHGGTIRHMLGYLFCQKSTEYNDMPVDPKNCSLSMLDIDKYSDIGPRIEYLNFYQY